MTTVFLDTECLGLDRMAPIWEFAGIRIEDDGTESHREHFQIKHRNTFWLDEFVRDAPTFAADYEARYDRETARWECDAADRIAYIVDGATIAGSNPSFDMDRLAILLRRAIGLNTPGWHYHPLDVPTLALGWLARAGQIPPRPWKSDAISKLAGVDPADYARHTAIGDVEWTLALYRAVGGEVW